jgi:hypothetical protein
MSTVELTNEEWGQVMGCMGYAPGRECIPLLNKIGAQLAAQHPRPPQQAPVNFGEIKLDANGREVSHE